MTNTISLDDYELVPIYEDLNDCASFTPYGDQEPVGYLLRPKQSIKEES